MQFQKAAARQVLSVRETINEELLIKTAPQRHQVIQTGTRQTLEFLQDLG